MIVIAENLNTRNREYMNALKKKDSKKLSSLAKKLAGFLPDIINIQCSLDGAGDEDILPWVTKTVSNAAKTGIVLDTRNITALRKALPYCGKSPLINFLSETEPEDADTLMELVADSGSSLVLRASKGIIPNTLEAKLQIIEGLLEKANSADIPNERLFADPSLVHMARGMGQKNLSNSYDCIRLLKELLDPPIRTIAWISNISTGLPKKLRKPLEASLLTYLAGAGLDAAMLDIYDINIRRSTYLIKSFRDEVVFSPADIA